MSEFKLPPIRVEQRRRWRDREAENIIEAHNVDDVIAISHALSPAFVEINSDEPLGPLPPSEGGQP